MLGIEVLNQTSSFLYNLGRFAELYRLISFIFWY